MSNQLVLMEAKRHGYAEGIALASDGTVSEGSGENLFVVKDGALITPGMTTSILLGITRATVFAIAADLGYEIVEKPIAREFLYLADEVFFTGSAAEITPISRIDNIVIGEGTAGPITRQLQQTFFDILHGKVDDRYGWLTMVPEYKKVAV